MDDALRTAYASNASPPDNINTISVPARYYRVRLVPWKGCATIIGFFGHAVGETNEELKALIGVAKAFAGSGFLLSTRNTELFRWCLVNGLRVTQPMTLMSLGLYNEPAGAFLSSITY